MEEGKKLSIINAGFKAFAEYGYTKASVEEIVKEANISKGSLFYYFESKKNFFVYLYEYCGEQLERLVDSPGPDGKPSYMIYTDFFERLNAIHLLKMKHSNDYPHMNKFMTKVVFETDPIVNDEISKINERYVKERAMLFFQGLDYYKFKDGIDPMMVIQLLTWCSEGILNQVQMQEKMNPSSDTTTDMEKVINIYYSYVNLFRNNFYKEEYLS